MPVHCARTYSHAHTHAHTHASTCTSVCVIIVTFFVVRLHLDYSCDPCVYSSCDVTCGPGVQFGSMHCVLIYEDTATVLDEYDIKCPNLECNTTCTTTESAPIETPTVSDDTVTPGGTTTTADETTAGTVSGTFLAKRLPTTPGEADSCGWVQLLYTNQVVTNLHRSHRHNKQP